MNSSVHSFCSEIWSFKRILNLLSSDVGIILKPVFRIIPNYYNLWLCPSFHEIKNFVLTDELRSGITHFKAQFLPPELVGGKVKQMGETDEFMLRNDSKIHITGKNILEIRLDREHFYQFLRNKKGWPVVASTGSLLLASGLQVEQPTGLLFPNKWQLADWTLHLY